MDYQHARHAGNAGDVLKHVALVALLESLLGSDEPLAYVETHAGDGLYPLGSAGEWGEGLSRVWGEREGLVGRTAQIARSLSDPGAGRPGAAPGSPLVARALLRPRDHMVLHEIDPRSASVLRRTVPQAEVREGDGLAAIAGFADRPRTLLLIDPPYAQKQEWMDAARALEKLGTTPAALWYPVKALTRPRALIAELAKLGVHGVAVELHWTPLRLKRDRLNGAGLVLVHAPGAAVSALCAVLPSLGALLKTHGEWLALQLGF